MKTTTISAKIDPILKSSVENILTALGISHSQAILMFYSQINLQKAIPFEIKMPKEFNRKTIKAMKEKNLEVFDNVNDLLEDLKR